MTSPETALENRVARSLERAGLRYQRQPAVAGLRPDFLVYGPMGQTMVVEAKSWPAGGSSIARARKQAEYYKQLTRADHVLLLLDGLDEAHTEASIASEDTLLKRIAEAFSGPAARSLIASSAKAAKVLLRERGSSALPGAAPRAKDNKPVVFAAMPFDRRYDDTYFVAMVHAAKRVGAVCERVDQSNFTRDIVDEIKRLIRSSAAVIVDLSESKPNVLYEAGYAHALEKPVVHICSTSLDRLPFDVRNWNALRYEVGSTSTLRSPLTRRLRAAMAP